MLVLSNSCTAPESSELGARESGYFGTWPTAGQRMQGPAYCCNNCTLMQPRDACARSEHFQPAQRYQFVLLPSLDA